LSYHIRLAEPLNIQSESMGSIPKPTLLSPLFLKILSNLLLLTFGWSRPALPSPATATTTTASSQGKVLVLFVNAISLTDLAEAPTPTLHTLIKQGALGLANVRTGGAFSPENAYATIGAIDRAVGSSRAGEAFVEDENTEHGRAGQVFARSTGITPPPRSIVVLDYPYLLRANTRFRQEAGLGALGEYLTNYGKIGAVIGNADTEQPGREIALTLMDKRGIVYAGQVGTELTRDNPRKLYGLETDYHQVLVAIRALLPAADCLLIETGDTSRLEKGRDLILPARRKKLLHAALGDFDAFLRQLRPEIPEEDLVLLIVSAYPSREASTQGDTLTPVLAVGPGFAPGLLYSPSTRQPGIISIFDLQSTLLAAVGLKTPDRFQGRPLSSVPHADPLGYLQKANARIIKVNKDRSPILKGFVVLQIILILSALTVILLRPSSPFYYQLLSMLLPGITSVPLALLALPLFNLEGVFKISLYLIFITIGVGVISFHKKLAAPRLPGLLALVTALAVLLDTMAHSPLMKESILGFSPVGGARYYGIGNEYLGILLGASVTGATILMDWTRRKTLFFYLSILFYAAITYFAAAPWFGSNFGGGVSLSVTYLLIMLLFSRKKRSRRRIIFTALAGAALIVTVFALIDLFNITGEQSHIGRFAANIRHHGIQAAAPIILRKIRMNLKLLEYTIWTKALLSFLAVLLVLTYRPSGKLAEIAERYPLFLKGFWSAVIGSIVALLVNDSGIVAAATSLLYPVMTVLTIVVGDLSPAEHM